MNQYIKSTQPSIPAPITQANIRQAVSLWFSDRAIATINAKVTLNNNGNGFGDQPNNFLAEVPSLDGVYISGYYVSVLNVKNA